jgi:anti-anti-sigma factor
VDQTRLPIQFEATRDFVQMALGPEITQLPWNLVEECGDQAIAKLKECRASSLLVDLTSLNYLGSAQVALLARIWKVLAAQNGAMAVQTNSPVVREVIRTAGLHRLWSLVESREQGLQKLGINDTGVRVVPTRWTIGPGVTAIASLLLSALTWKGPGEWRFWAGCGTLLMGSLAVFLSRRAIAKAQQGQRALGVLSLLVGLGSVAAGAFFVWPRSDVDAQLVDPERAAGVRVDDPEGFGESGEVFEDTPLPNETIPLAPSPAPPSPAPPSPENQPPRVAPTKPATQSESLPGPALPHPTQPASPSGSPTPPPASPDHDSVEPVSANSPPDSPPVTPGERPEAPFEPVDHENTN